MSTILFYEKPGCSNNSRQKAQLAAAGHTVIAKNLLTEPWTRERLLQFFGSLPVHAWFNPAAPKIRDGEIDPATLDADTALAMLRAEPLLIRRPLIEVDGQRMTGFDASTLSVWLGQPILVNTASQSCLRYHPSQR